MKVVTGAEALTEVLGRWRYSTVFAYPGTSELELCAAIAGRDAMRLVNARGDKEAAFMAAGGNLLGRATCAAVLHGARGLTNALGAVADVRRSEVPLLCLVGMPSRSSARYLPPHAEPGLIKHAGTFARAAVDCSTMAALDPRAYLTLVGEALSALDQTPPGPVLLGLPHDVLVSRFVPLELVAEMTPPVPPRGEPAVSEALVLIEASERPVILVDDYLLRSPTAEYDLASFATRLGAPVMQVAYRRGPMFFEQLRASAVPTYRGHYDPEDAHQRGLLDSADLLITIEDRNMYPRVVGRLPSCRKVAITSNGSGTVKNGYLRLSDVLVVGNACDILIKLTQRLARPARQSPRGPALTGVGTEHTRGSQRRLSDPDQHNASADELARAIARGLHAVPSPVVVDDGQMFGGLLARNYHHLPASVRVFASHGGFVGGGLATAVGLATAHSEVAVVATLGDQGFTNGVQALAAAREQQVPLLVLVCNNGASVSLATQATADGVNEAMRSALGNVPGMGYATIASGFGTSASTYVWPDTRSEQDAMAASRRLTADITKALTTGGTYVLELITPDSPRFWAGVWRVDGFEEPPGTPPKSAGPGG
ncbi:MAG: thiamine pyrophosphate-binding protein [Actinobacteria bacterium]|nr:thiamine pyrophosphate-binding protein [Actinomycetota bacterium]